MAAAALRKRKIAIAEEDDSPARSTRAKRRAVTLEVSARTTAEEQPQSISRVAVPKDDDIKRVLISKSRAQSRKVAASPTNIKSRTKAPQIEIYRDCKEDVVQNTPRHRDAATKVTVTPKHRQIESRDSTTPRTPHTPSRSSTAVYNQARQIFSRSTNPGRLIGRETERAELVGFIEQKGGCLYISGPPGTGKSALVNEVCEGYNEQSKVHAYTLNCMSIRTTSDLVAKLVAELGLDESSTIKDLQTYFTSSSNSVPFLVILDEVDRLLALDIEVLYSLFEWALAPQSRLKVIGIANALDLTDRCLPKLRSRGLKPDLLPFLPYTATQIAEVLTAKVQSINGADGETIPFLHPTAIQFCAKKIAAQTGDLRKAFDVCQRAIDLVEQETITRDAKSLLHSPSKTPLMDNINLSSPVTPKSPSKNVKLAGSPIYTVATAPRATIAHMAKVTSQVFSNGSTQRLTTLNLQQKAVMCSLAALEKRKRALQLDRVMSATPSKSDRSAPTTKQLYETYTGLCRRSEMLHPLTAIEFRDIVSGLEAQGLVTGSDGKHGTFVTPITPSRTPSRKNKTGFGVAVTGDGRRITSVVGEREIRTVLEGVAGELLREILDGDC